MKAVILAAGEGTRMRPLTDDTPKPLLPVAGKPIIQHTIDSIESMVDEIIVVAGYRKQQVEDYFAGKDVKVVEQEEALGTAHAALQAIEHIKGKTMVINGDDIYQVPERITRIDSGILVDRVEDPGNYGVIELKDDNVAGIQEKPENPESDLVNTGFYMVQEDFFELLDDVDESERGEYEITDAVEKYIEEYEMEVIEADQWLPCSYPWQLTEANETLVENVERNIEGEIAETATVEGPAVIEEGARINDYTLVEGPAIIKKGAEIGPHAHVRPGTVIHEGAEVGRSEIKNSVLREGAAAPHFNYVGDSYIGKSVNLGAGSKTANMRNDSSSIEVYVKGEAVDSHRQKLGSFIGSGTKIGVNCSINPGVLVGSEVITDSNEKISRNIPSDSRLVDGEVSEDRN